jgi:regulator of protease activity HflC (stomatin/prohibitin superfamily)
MCLCCTTISTGEMGLVECFGKFDRIASPGLVVFPWPMAQVRLI